ncbi:hypothetical protein EV361DRAFT_956387 [Lentinula raphanica]|nr:hypothetical protein EV361DRAFT_956387 [Lentinula raphanica]
MSTLLITPEMLERRTRKGGVYDTMLNNKIGFNSSSLARIDYGVHFTKTQGNKDSDMFVGRDRKEFTTNVFGQISEGFVAHPTGSYNGISEGIFHPITDLQRIKMQLDLECPFDAPPKMKGMFHNLLSTLDNIVDKEANQSRYTRTWLCSSQDNGDMDRFHINTQPLFKPASDSQSGNLKTKVKIELDNGDEPPAAIAPTSSNQTTQLSDTYPCSIWPGYGGPWFNHTNARAVQLNIRDPQGRLIRPDETYLWLAPGAIVLIHATMHIFKYKQTSYFQLNATSIQIIDKSDINVAPPSVLSLPSPDKTRFGSASAADSAPILNFSSMMNTETASMTVPAASSSRAPHTRKHDIDIDNDMFDTPIDVNNLSHRIQ